MALGWRHGGAVDELATGRAAVLAEYDAHRARIRSGENTVALGAAFGDTLSRHEALLKVAEPFRARPRTFDRLLAERGEIGRRDLDDFEAQYVRAREHRRAVAVKAASAQRREAGRVREPRQREGMPPLPETDARHEALITYEALKQDWSRHLAGAERAGVHALDADGCDQLRVRMETLAQYTALDDGPRQILARVLGQLDAETAMRREIAEQQAALDTYEVLKQDWSRHLASAEQAGVHALDTNGYDRLRVRMEALAQNRALDDAPRQTLTRVLGQLDTEIAARRKIEDYFDVFSGRKAPAQAGADQAWPEQAGTGAKQAVRDIYEVLKQDWSHHLAEAEQTGVRIRDTEGYGQLHARMEALAQNPNLDDAPRQTLSRVLGQLDAETEAQRKIEDYLKTFTGQRDGHRDVTSRTPEKGIAHILDDPGKLRELREEYEERQRKAGREQSKGRGLSM